MRLICPNCGAQYDVPDEVIPAAGRDVQCSNCGHTWFQKHPDQDAELAEDLNQPLPDPEWSPEAEEEETALPQEDDHTPHEHSPAAEHYAEQLHEAEARLDDEHPPQAAMAAAEGPAKPRGLDPEVADIFREEREFEARLRATETMESQPDLGLLDPDEDEYARRSRQARERMAKLRGDEPGLRPAPRKPSRPAIPVEAYPEPEHDSFDDETESRAISETAAAAAAAASSRRDLLPDVDEINQTLRATSEPRVIDTATARDPAPVERASGGFGKGFALVLVLGFLAISSYVMAPKLAEALPPAAPALNAYVETVNGARRWLDGQVTALLMTLDGMSSEAAPKDAQGATVSPDAPTE